MCGLWLIFFVWLECDKHDTSEFCFLDEKKSQKKVSFVVDYCTNYVLKKHTYGLQWSLSHSPSFVYLFIYFYWVCQNVIVYDWQSHIDIRTYDKHDFENLITLDINIYIYIHVTKTPATSGPSQKDIYLYVSDKSVKCLSP